MEELRRFVQLEGSRVGVANCMWADEFAQAIVADFLNICILFVDMERSPGTSPYRILASAKDPSGVVILKRQG